MQHHMQQGPPGQQHPQPAVPMHQQHRRDYHGYHQMQMAPGPMYYPQQYYAPPQHYAPRHWQQQPPYVPQLQHYGPPMHMQQQQYAPPRSPMVVTSQPHLAMTPVTRQQTIPPQSTQSPRPVPPYVHQHPHTSAAVSSPSPAPAQALPPTTTAPQPEAARIETPPLPTSRRQSTATNPLSLPPEHKEPYWPALPVLFREGVTVYPVEPGSFPPRAAGRRRRRRNMRSTADAAVALPRQESSEVEEATVADEVVGAQEDMPRATHAEVASLQEDSKEASAEDPTSESSTIAAPSEQETPATSQAPSESDFTQVSTPATPAQAPSESPKATPTQQHTRRDTRSKIAVPVIPGLPKPSKETTSRPSTAEDATPARPENQTTPRADDEQSVVTAEQREKVEEEKPKLPFAPAPKSWADLVKRNTKPAIGAAAAATTNGNVVTTSPPLPKSAPLADALRQYDVQRDLQISFLEPRGLVNTGNMCYMNSILQVLVFCVPFYSFLDQVRQRTVHSMKSDTPLIDAVIMFMREFKILASAESAEALRSQLKQEQLEQYGEPVTPEYVYEVIQRLPRFASMRRGHQQDAEEFLGFLLEGLHDECVKVMQGQSDNKRQENGVTPLSTIPSPKSAADDGWLEVGPKQKASETRTAGQQDAPTPITKIFGGHLRSELRVPGKKDSVTLEPYKPLQLDIGAQNVNNIIDALKGLTRTEAFEGDFGGRGNTAKKQVFIETLPPVLVLHLKRFQYENSGGTQKIWKKIGYPLDLEIPKEVFSPAKRAGMGAAKPVPRYRLTAVVYHHGKSAAGGHYTVDVLRQDSREWVRMDDTVIRRIRAEDVAEGGSEEDPKLLAKALEQHKDDQELQKQRNAFAGLDEEEPQEEKPWSAVNGHAKKFSNATAATNGTATPSSAGKRTPKPTVRDNKVAYILLYEKRE